MKNFNNLQSSNSKMLYAVWSFKDRLDSVDPETLDMHEYVQYMEQKETPIYLRQGRLIVEITDDKLDRWLSQDVHKLKSIVSNDRCWSCFYLDKTDFREFKHYLADLIATGNVYIDELQQMMQVYKKLKEIDLDNFAGFVYVCEV